MKKTTRQKEFVPGRGYTKEDWDEVSDNPEWTAERIARAKPFAEVFPDLADSIKRARGRPRIEAPKEAVTLRLAPATLARFRAAGKDWRTRMAQILDKAKV
jgi:uncharacterized protein (DUF4415 family)